MRIGWVGTGLMGSRMLPHLLRAGHETVVYARNRDAAGPLVDAGARLVATGADVAAAVDVTFTMVATPADVEEVYFGTAGLLGSAPQGATLVDMTSSSPALARRIAQAGLERGVHTLDAPVSGGPAGADGATLSIMVGGDAGTLAHVRPLLDLLGATIVHHGPAGAGQSAKITNQIMVGVSMVGLSEAFLFARASGLRPEAVLETLRAGIVGSPLLAYMWPRIAAGDLEPGFRVEHLIKDLGLALDAAHDEKIALPGTALTKELYHAVRSAGHAGKGTQALITALDRSWGTGPTAGAEPPP